jgi:hypothetical protein
MAINKRFIGKDKFDLDRQQWDWQSANPRAVVTKVHPDEMLPVGMSPVRHGAKISTPDTISKQIERSFENKPVVGGAFSAHQSGP